VENIINKMFGKRKKVLFGNNILLPANMTKRPMDNGAAVQTVFFFTVWLVAQANFFLKIARNQGEQQDNAGFLSCWIKFVEHIRGYCNHLQ
jgi:hypothetical protein